MHLMLDAAGNLCQGESGFIANANTVNHRACSISSGVSITHFSLSLMQLCNNTNLFFFIITMVTGFSLCICVCGIIICEPVQTSVGLYSESYREDSMNSLSAKQQITLSVDHTSRCGRIKSPCTVSIW